MAEAAIIRLGLFVEDRAHEAFLRALVNRFQRERGVAIKLKVIQNKGGRGAVFSKLNNYGRILDRRPEGIDSHLIAIDANCRGWNEQRSAIKKELPPELESAAIIACPDPHIERWFLADPESLARTFDLQVSRTRRKCERDYYKKRLKAAFQDAGHPLTLGGIEFAEEIVEVMDLYRAGKNEPSLRLVIEEIGHMVALRTADGARSGEDNS